uniref:Uncharacterized protein n=1 Tax=Bactrocera dorsalis TaxID=27457 RepID=A0A034WW77_BACDO
MSLRRTMHPMMMAAVQMLTNPQDKLLPHHLLEDVGAAPQKLALIDVEETQMLKGRELPQPKEMPERPQSGHQQREQQLEDKQQSEGRQQFEDKRQLKEGGLTEEVKW